MTLILVTGASGFVGSHVVDELLRQGYSVRGAVRSHNVPRIRKSYESFGDRFTTTVIDDIATSDFSQAVEGVDVIMHVASPLPNSSTPQAILDGAVSGTTRILDAAVAAGVKQVIITASIVSLVAMTDFWKDITITEKSYNPLTAEDALQPDAPPFLVYSVSKGLADRAVRDFKRAHPDLDLTTIHPGYVFGPLGSGQVYNSPATGSNRYIYSLIADGASDRPVGEYDPAVRVPPLNVDVRDVARAHVLALKVPPSDEPKRFILSTSTFTWTEAIELIVKARPELKGRLPLVTGNERPVPPFATIDTSATENVLGLRNYVKWQDTVLDTIDDLLRVEKEVAASAQ